MALWSLKLLTLERERVIEAYGRVKKLARNDGEHLQQNDLVAPLLGSTQMTSSEL